MLKMVIRMNDDKITAENKYRLDGIYNTINHTFQTVGRYIRYNKLRASKKSFK